MKLQNVVSILNESIVTVECQFDKNGKKYTFKCDKQIADTLQPDDIVIVTAKAKLHQDSIVKNLDIGMPQERYGINTCYVVQVHDDCEIDPESNLEYKWIIQKLETEALKATVQKEQDLLKQLRNDRRKHLRNQLRQQYITGSTEGAGALVDGSADLDVSAAEFQDSDT